MTEKHWKVVIVNEGEWGMLRQAEGDYDSWVSTLQQMAELSAKADEHVSVEVVQSLQDAMLKIRKDDVDVVFFITRAMLGKARKALEELGKIPGRAPRMVLFTGLLPKDEVILLRKSWATPNLIQSIIRG